MKIFVLATKKKKRSPNKYLKNTRVSNVRNALGKNQETGGRLADRCIYLFIYFKHAVKARPEGALKMAAMQMQPVRYSVTAQNWQLPGLWRQLENFILLVQKRSI